MSCPVSVPACVFVVFHRQGLELHPSCAGLQVSAFMLTPVQRMPRYVLLLKVSLHGVLNVLHSATAFA